MYICVCACAHKRPASVPSLTAALCRIHNLTKCRVWHTCTVCVCLCERKMKRERRRGRKVREGERERKNRNKCNTEKHTKQPIPLLRSTRRWPQGQHCTSPDHEAKH